MSDAQWIRSVIYLHVSWKMSIVSKKVADENTERSPRGYIYYFAGSERTLTAELQNLGSGSQKKAPLLPDENMMLRAGLKDDLLWHTKR